MAVTFDLKQQVELKLDYLKELRELLESEVLSDDGVEALAVRCVRVCDSIGKDLGISKPFSVGDMTVKVNIDTTDMQKSVEQLREIMEKAAEIRISPPPIL